MTTPANSPQPVELIVLVGIQASGKTTYYRQRLAGRYIHVSLDNWRGKGNVRGKERQAILDGLAEAAASGGRVRGVVVDNTNTTAATRRRYFEMAAEFAAPAGGQVRLAACFFDADLAGCLERNAARPADAPVGEPYFVPPKAIARFRQMLEPPTVAEGFEEVVRIRIAAGGFEEERQEARHA